MRDRARYRLWDEIGKVAGIVHREPHSAKKEAEVGSIDVVQGVLVCDRDTKDYVIRLRLFGEVRFG